MNSTSGSIHCYYSIWASRIDGEPLIVEYEGDDPSSYPGNSDQFSISGYDYGRGVDNSWLSWYHYIKILILMSDDFCSLDEEYVTNVVIDVCRRSFLLVSNQGVMQEISCDDIVQFMDLLSMVNCVLDIDTDIKIVYVDPIVSDNAGVV